MKSISFPRASKFFLISEILLITAFVFCSKNKKSVPLAQVNNDVISVADFGRRLNFFSRITGIKDNLQTREDLLNQMINEQLLIQDFHRRGWDSDADFRRIAESIRAQYYLDTYRKKMFFDTVSVSEKELAKQFRLSKQKVAARHLYARTREQAEELYARLQNGEDFSELAHATFQDATLAENGGYLGYFGKGEMDPAFEKAAFSLKVGEISRPVKTRYGYSIIKLEDRIFIPIASESDFIAAKPKLEKEIRLEKNIQYAQKLGKKLAENLRPEFNQKLVQFIFSRMKEFNKRTSRNLDSEERSLSVALADVAEETLVNFKGGKWTVADFLEQAKHTSPRQQRRIETSDDLKQFVVGLRVRQELLKAAEKSGVKEDKKLQKEIAHAIDGAIVGRMLRVISDTVTVPTEALKEAYEKNADGYFFQEQANVREILVGEEGAARRLLQKVRNGESFAGLSKKYSLRKWAAERGGELGFSPRSRFGSLADSIFQLNPGEIAGPFPVEGFYAIVQMIKKKPARPKTFEEAKEQIATELLWKWRRIRLHNFVEQLHQQANIRIDKEKLRWTVFSE
ncbi:MAG: hypothetical protein GXO74_05785 [Calditrichaeota bacterium]|nr:hypothetical protein [Calditrichota bacterium]